MNLYFESERRTAARRPLTITIRVDDSDGVTWSSSADLSSGGACLRSSIPRPPGEQVRLSLELPGESELTCVGRVVAMRKDGGVGFAFEDLTETERTRLARFVSAAADTYGFC